MLIAGLVARAPAFPHADAAAVIQLNEDFEAGLGAGRGNIEGSIRVRYLLACQGVNSSSMDFASLPGEARNTIRPPYVIFDSDFGNDPGDVGALTMLHAMADLGEICILGMANCNTDLAGPGAMDAVNTYYGRPDIPVGRNTGTALNPGPYPNLWNTAIAAFWPNSFGTSGTAAESATTLYRRLLHLAPDGSVMIVAGGQMANLEALRTSLADANSPFTGVELLNRKSRKILVSAGQYPSGNEYNFYTDPTNASNFVANVSATIPIRFNGYEVGNQIVTGSAITNNAAVSSPVSYVYNVYSLAENDYNGRESWDQMGILGGVRGLYRAGVTYFTESAQGTNTVSPGGTNWFATGGSKDQRYLTNASSASTYVTLIDGLMNATPKFLNNSGSIVQSNICTNRVTAFWKFNEATGGPWVSSVGSLSLTNISGGGTITNVAGVFGTNSAAHFNGTTCGMTLPHTTELNGGNSQYSITAIVKLDTTNGVDHTIMGKGTGTAFDYYFYIPSGGKPALFVYDGAASASSVGSVQSTVALTPNTTNLIECGVIPQYSGSNARLYMRINNGVPVYALTSGTPGTNTSSRIGVGINPGSFGGQILQGNLESLQFRKTINGQLESTHIYNGGSFREWPY